MEDEEPVHEPERDGVLAVTAVALAAHRSEVEVVVGEMFRKPELDGIVSAEEVTDLQFDLGRVGAAADTDVVVDLEDAGDFAGWQ
jgi:hypothetical protein